MTEIILDDMGGADCPFHGEAFIDDCRCCKGSGEVMDCGKRVTCPHCEGCGRTCLQCEHERGEDWAAEQAMDAAGGPGATA